MAIEDLVEKLAEQVATNITSVGGEMEVYEDPPGRPEGTISAPWGERPHDDPFHNSDGVWREYKNSNAELVDRILNQFGEQSREDKAYISAHFVNGKQGKFTAHSPLLNKHASLMERVVALTGRK